MADDDDWSMREDPAEAEQHRYHIGEFAERVGLSHRTIRHYDDLGIVKPSGRTAGGFRVYTDRDVRRFLLIKPFKPLDIGLADARAVIEALDVLQDEAAGRPELEAARATLERIIRLVAKERAEKEAAIRMCEATVAELRAAIDHRP